MDLIPAMFDLNGVRILVTGAGRLNGIGAAISAGLAQQGATVIIHGREMTEESQQVLSQLKAINPQCDFVSQDLSAPNAGKALITLVERDFGPIDVFIANHSLQVLGDFVELSNEQIQQQVQVNFLVNVQMLQTILPIMVSRKRGKIINIGSVNQDLPKAVVSVYAAMKAAQHNLVKSLAREFASQGVLMNTISPGLVDTYPENRAGDQQACQAWDDYASQLNWLGRAGLPSEMAGAAVYLASSASNFMTGETINLTGGN